MEYLLAFGLSLFLSAVLVPFFIYYATALKLIDEPNEARKIHVKSIPRCGGLGIFAGVFLSSFYWLEASNTFLTLGFASLIIVIFGYLDDSRNLNYRWKFLGQLIATVVLIAGGITFSEVPFFGVEEAPTYISYPLTLFFVLGATNAVNLSDGLDGLAAGNTLLSLLLIAFLSFYTGNVSCLALALAIIGGLLGFLRYNTHPADVFMGDAGSQFLGFVTASLAILVTQGEQSAFNPALPLLILGLPILDTLMVMVLRTMQGRFIFSPDQNHIHHQLIHLGFRHYEVVALLYGLQTIMVLSAYFMRYEHELVILLFYGVFSAVVCGVLYWARQSSFRPNFENKPVNVRERRGLLVRKIDWYYHNSSIVLASLMGVFLISGAFYSTVPQNGFSELCLLMAAALSSLWLLLRTRWVSVVTRVIIYSASALITYNFSFGEEWQQVFNFGVDLYLLLLLIAFLLAIRMTRKTVFRLDAHDYLVFILLLTIPFVSFEGLSDISLTKLIFRWALLIYIGEFLLSKKRVGYAWLNLTGILSLVILGV